MSHHYLLITLGSSGDVFPYVAIGKALKERGHEVTCATNEHFRGRIESQGLRFSQIGTQADFVKATGAPELWDNRKSLEHVVEQAFAPAIRPVYELIRSQDLSRTTVLASGFSFGARIAQEKLGARVVSVHLQPSNLWSLERPSVAAGMEALHRLPSFLRRALLKGIDRFLLDRVFGRPVNAFRKELGLPEARGILSQWVHSPWKTIGLFPEWFGPPAADWPKQVKLTGFVRYDGEPEEVPEELTRFLAEGEPPLVFTPGSAMGHANAFLSACSKAARLLGRRAVLLAPLMKGKVDPAILSPTVRYFPFVPFSRVLPRTAAFVHHGGIGTCAQALAAGVPQLVCPFTFDQPDNAWRLREMGVSDTLPSRKLKAEEMARKLEALLRSSPVAEKCRQYAQRVDFAASLEETCREVTRD